MHAVPDAVLWDMDGTVADTEDLWIGARARLADSCGVPWSASDTAAYIGQPIDQLVALLRRRGARASAQELIGRLLRDVEAQLRSEIRWRPGARELLTELVEAGIPCALVTMAYRPIATLIAHEAHPTAFQVIVAGDDVTCSKPHPEPYLLAIQRLDADPGLSIAIEDSGTGADSANTAGITTLVVPSLVPVPAAPDRHQRPSLQGVRLADLAALLPPAHTAPKSVVAANTARAGRRSATSTHPIRELGQRNRNDLTPSTLDSQTRIRV